MDQTDDEFREFVLSALAQFENRLVHYVTRLLSGDENMARDVVQHAFLKLCQQDHETVRDRIGPWLFRVVRNRVIDLQRRLANDHPIDFMADQPDVGQLDPFQEIESKDLFNYVHDLVGRLPPSQQEVVELWSHGLKHDEIAEITGKKAGAVRGILHRAIQTLKQDPQIRIWLSESTQQTTKQRA